MNKLFISRSGDGHVNLAADEFILEQYRRGIYGGVTLYFYVNSAAVIIGRNQNAWRECNIARMEEDGVQLVRRHTGGGAVFHDGGNLNFSFITNEKLYDKERFTKVILSACASLGIEAEVNGRNDLTVSGRKFSGCAYGLSGTARAMHGTLLISAGLDRLQSYLSPSQKKLAAKGVASVRSRVANLNEFARITVDSMRAAVINAFTAEFGAAEELALSAEDERRIAELADRQRSWEWRIGCTPEFTAQIDERFSFGELQLSLLLKNGVVKDVKAFTDALDASLPERLCSALIGRRYGPQSLAKALMKGGAEERELAQYLLREEEMNDNELIERAREELARIPELAFGEIKTKAYIKDFIEKHTDLELHDMGAWIYAAHREGAEVTLAVRADFDAVPDGDSARHLCGHNGHTAALLGLALLLKGKRVGKNLILLFQHAEETGAGAPECSMLFELEHIDAIIGAHNIPGGPMGKLLFRRGTFACASCGLEISMQGLPTHAAYPENGVNPTGAIAQLALALPKLADELTKKYSRMTLATIVGMRTGERAFGVAASDGRLWVTLRSESTEALKELVKNAEEKAEALAKEYGVGLKTAVFDEFPATVNDDGLMDAVEKAAGESGLDHEYLEVPFRWSEDFGHYGRLAPAVFFGIGSGEGTCPLHTKDYAYPAGLAGKTAEAFYKLASGLSVIKRVKNE